MKTKFKVLSAILSLCMLIPIFSPAAAYAAYDEGSEECLYLGDILVYDAVGKPDEGSMTVETVEEGERYLLTVSANTDYLTDPTT